MSFSSKWVGKGSERLLAGVAFIVLTAMGLPIVPCELTAGSLVPLQGGILYSVNTTIDTVVIGACQNGLPDCSLRGAIQTANSHPGIDGIAFDLPAGAVIHLTQAL